MQTVIHSSDFALTDALNNFIKHQARKSMSTCSNRVERLVIRLKDINGPKGGDDKECCVEVKLANCAPIVVSKRSSDAYSSIRKALGRASRTTLRKLGKRRTHKTDYRASTLFEPIRDSEHIDEMLDQLDYRNI
jgi:ribosome-associated translation inhibitor RaiA